jgi:hypothetical protein
MIKLFTLLFLYLPIAGAKVAPADPIDNTVSLLKSNNIHELAKSFTPMVDVTLLNDDNTYTAAQAETKLADFFSKNPVKAVTVVHRVNSNSNIRFAVLTMVTGSGTYRTAVSFRLTNGQFLLNEIRIEAEKK